MDGGESDLEAEREPPDLFRRPEQEPNYKNISSLKLELEEEPIDPYIERFEDDVRDDVLMIGNISLEEVQVCRIKSRVEPRTSHLKLNQELAT